ncbi:hypothetical protein ABKT97_01485 [Enterobacter hormaechei]
MRRKSIMNKFILVLPLVFASFFLNAKTVPVVTDILSPNNSTSWVSYLISEPIILGGEDVTKDSIDVIFKGNNIVIDNTNVSIGNICKYEYSKESISPLEYWHSEKTVDLYKKFLSAYNIKLGGKLNLITPINPSVKCDYPFSYFIEVDGSLVFILKNRAIIYSHNNKNDDVPNSVCMHKEQSLEQIFENGDIEECFYKNKNILSSYQKYRDSLTNDNKKYLRKNIELNKSFSMKCDNGCITVIYKWDGPDHLTISQQFDGGETEISFSKEVQGCRVVTKSLPD